MTGRRCWFLKNVFLEHRNNTACCLFDMLGHVKCVVIAVPAVKIDVPAYDATRRICNEGL